MDDMQLTIVDGYRIQDSVLDLSTLDVWHLALDQRAFGPRRLVVATADVDGRLLGLAHCVRTEPPEVALECCLATLDDGAAAAVAYSDEPIGAQPPPGMTERFAAARAAARRQGVHLVDWILCDDTQFRSMCISLEDFDEWWDVPMDAAPHPKRDGPASRP